MATSSDGVVAGVLAGLAGAGAHNAVAYLVQLVTSTPPPASPTSATPTETARSLAGASAGRSAAAGPLGGLGIGVGVGAVAGALRSLSTTPPQPAAAAVLGLTAWGTSAAVTSATHTPRDTSVTAMVGDLAAHLAYGLVTVLTLHRLLDPRTPHAHR